MFCKKCGTELGDSKFCPKCGEAVTAAPAPAAPAYSGKVVNKIAYGLIAIFIGGIGIHRFYAGRPVSGVLYLLFCWTIIPSIIAFIEGIVALCREDDGFGNIPVVEGKYFV